MRYTSPKGQCLISSIWSKSTTTTTTTTKIGSSSFYLFRSKNIHKEKKQANLAAPRIRMHSDPITTIQSLSSINRNSSTSCSDPSWLNQIQLSFDEIKFLHQWNAQSSQIWPQTIEKPININTNPRSMNQSDQYKEISLRSKRITRSNIKIKIKT